LLTVFACAHDASRELFEGVRLIHVRKEAPEPLSYFLVSIDLAAPGLRFTTTAPNGDAPRDTWTETTRDFVGSTGAQLGINASFFSYDNEPHTDVLGLAVSDGVKYSPWSRGLPYGVNFSKDNAVTFIEPASPAPTGYESRPSVPLYNAVAGNLRIVRDGKNTTVPEGKRHPRTAVGLTKDNTLLLLVVDGRHPEYSVGMTAHELAETLLRHGARDAINLDGGGSSTLVVADPEPRVVNVPLPFDLPEGAAVPERGIERKVGNNIAVFARPVKAE